MLTKAQIKYRDIFNGHVLRDYKIVTSIMKGNYFVGEKAGRFTVFRAEIHNLQFRVKIIGTESQYRTVSGAKRTITRLQDTIYTAIRKTLLN